MGGEQVRFDEGLVAVGERTVALSVRESQLLAALAERSGHVTRREDLYEQVWNRPLRPGDRTVDVYVRRLRVKLADVLPEWNLIHTHVAFGYRFQPERSQPFHRTVTRP